METEAVKQNVVESAKDNRLLIDTKNLDPEKVKRISILENYDISLITDKFSSKYSSLYSIPEQVYMTKTLLGRDITPEIAKKLENDFKKWISLTILEPKTSFAPISREMDMYWHLFILHTKEYNDFVNTVLGRRFGHQPTNEKIKDEVNQAGDNTRKLFHNLYGKSEVERLKEQPTTLLLRHDTMACQPADDCGPENICNPDHCGTGACQP